VDRDEPKLASLEADIRAQSSTMVRIIVTDLLAEKSAQELFDELEKEDVHGLINSAGLTYYGPTVAGQLDLYRSIIDLDFRLVVEAIYAAAKGAAQRYSESGLTVHMNRHRSLLLRLAGTIYDYDRYGRPA
jgi:short-subunit dehydrogenase